MMKTCYKMTNLKLPRVQTVQSIQLRKVFEYLIILQYLKKYSRKQIQINGEINA